MEIVVITLGLIIVVQNILFHIERIKLAQIAKANNIDEALAVTTPTKNSPPEEGETLLDVADIPTLDEINNLS